MSLPVPNLDDRRFQDLVDEAKRLIPRFCPEWTNHNVSDPGVALIELFAWMTEMTLFRLNQVPDAFYVRFLNLMGVEPYPPAAARAELTFWLAGPTDIAVTVPAGTQVSTTGEGSDNLVFSTLDDLVIAQPRLVAVRTALAEGSSGGGRPTWQDEWETLGYERAGVTVFRSEVPTAGDALYLGFVGSLAGTVLRLDFDATVEGIGVDPSRPPLAWEVWADEQWTEVELHGDDTGGLNRRGDIVLLIGAEHEPLTLDDQRAFWLRARLCPTREDQPTYQRSPRVLSVSSEVLGGTTVAEHSERVGPELLGTSDGQPGQAFVLRHQPVLSRRRREVVLIGSGGVQTEWSEVTDFAQSGPDDHHVQWDSTTGEIRFGPAIRYPDGRTRQHGGIPPAGASVKVASYRHGGGSIGNVGANTLTGLRAAVPYVGRVTNRHPARGGVDAESLANAKLRGPATVRTGERAVTVADYERLALAGHPEVTRARCLPPALAGEPVRLLLVPRVSSPRDRLRLDDLALSEDLTDELGAYLDQRRVLGTNIQLGTPYYQGVSVAALLRAAPGRASEAIRLRATDLLYSWISPFGSVGGSGNGEGNGDGDGDGGDGWPFETDLNGAAVSQLLGSIDGVERVEEVALFEFDLRNGTRTGAALDVVRLGADSLFLSAAHRIVVR
ncbi:MAG: putative baseplate assembly protein [Acidimicrobiales bacterium]